MALERFRKKKQSVDYLLALGIFTLAIIGIVMIFSASSVLSFEWYGNSYGIAMLQVRALVIGLLVFAVMSFVDYRIWQKYATTLLIITICLLVAVFIPGIGYEHGGAYRWLDLRVTRIQPSEIIKLIFIMYLSAWLCKKGEKINDFASSFIPFVIIMAIVSFLIMKEPDMGTMSVIAAASMAVFFISGVAWQYVLLLIGGAAVIGRILIYAAPYRLQRLLVFLNPTDTSSGPAYHINQALLAIGNGGWFGLGFGQSRQKYLFLPEPHTDSIFAVIGEELGFVRAALLLGLFVFIAWRGYEIARKSQDKFARFVATGITTWFICQAFLNIGAITGVLPLTGVPLPFVSFGGTALTINFAAAGILLNISRQTG